MKTISYTEDIQPEYKIPAYYTTQYPNGRFLFFDIETTGFAAAHTTLYLIGVLWYEDNSIHIRQWFNDDGYSEAELLHAFHTFSKDFTHLVDFNGSGFDIPYLHNKCITQGLQDPAWENLEQIDIFRLIRSYKNIFGLSSMKQTAIEDYLGIHREDTYTGKDLIHIYQRYVAKPNESEEHLLLLHNHDDLLGMPQLSVILNYTMFFEHMTITNLTITEEEPSLHLEWEHTSASCLPKRLAVSKNGIYLNADGQHASLWLPISERTLKHYFADYKNYYYLPQEDMAVHKRVATYVEPEHRVKATKATCYVKQHASFIPCYLPDSFDCFSEDCSSKQTYQTVQSLSDASPALQQATVLAILKQYI
ncbi:MAG: ribonuclease H-like domain-containing protein [Lachnospiraceae bacterium]|nr:ribonuclease H-like domain-containing protein [Lachnospiraceae bacterium]